MSGRDSESRIAMTWHLALVVILLAGCCGASSPAPPPPPPPPPSSASASGNSGVCVRPCVCKWKGGKESVTCHQAGWIEIPANGFDTSVQVLDLSGNPLTTLGANQFRKLGLTHLQRVILQRCSLRHVDSTAFAGLTNLVELDLSHNALSTVPGQAFVYAPELRELKLNGNPLVRINGSPFTAAAKLVRLEMANCQIIQLDVKAFTSLETLEWLRLDGNLIESLPTVALTPLRSLRGIDLHHNPWNCTCGLRPLRSWLAARNMPFSVPPLCLAPVRLRGQSWNRMPLDELACPPRVQPVESLVQSAVGQPATLSCSVKSNPEAAVSWFFADRLIVNMTSDEAANSHQVYFVRETGDKTDKVVQLVLNAAREQDSGFYVCQATNRADKVTANVTLLVKGGSEITSSRGFTAGLILAVFAILIAVLLVCCVCSLKRARSNASMRMRRRASSVSGLQSNGLFEKPADPFMQRQEDDRGLLKNRTNGASSRPSMDMGSVGTPPDSKMNEPTRFADKQWLVSREPDVRHSPPALKTHGTVRQSSVTSAESDGHRQIAMYQNHKVLFSPSPDADSSSPRLLPSKTDRPTLSPAGSHSILSLSSHQQQHHHQQQQQQQPSLRNYPDLVDVVPVVTGYEPSDTASVEEEVVHAIKQHPLESTGLFPAARYFQQRHPPSGRRLSVAESATNSGSLLSQRNRLSDWELNELDANHEWVTYSYNPQQSEFSYDSELEAVNAEMISRQPDEFEEDFQRRYAYHTGQLNRFLFEYRTLQKKLARMQDTWGRCLDAADFMAGPPVRQVRPNQYLAAPRPLRPILKNRLPPAVRPPPPPPVVVQPGWPAHYADGEDIVDSDSPPTPVNESPYDPTDEIYSYGS